MAAESGISPRPYRSALRRRQAAQTRQRVIQAAVELFGQQGYGATTLAQLAARAEVSVETIQKHGPKAALLLAAVEHSSFGVEGENDFFDTGLGKAMLTIDNPEDLATFVGEAMLAINEPSAGVWLAVVGAAHGDDEIRRYQAEMFARIRAQVANVLDYVDRRGWLRTDVDVEDLVEAACIVTGVDTYIRFVKVDGMSREAYRAFVARTMRESILARRPASARAR